MFVTSKWIPIRLITNSTIQTGIRSTNINNGTASILKPDRKNIIKFYILFYVRPVNPVGHVQENWLTPAWVHVAPFSQGLGMQFCIRRSHLYPMYKFMKLKFLFFYKLDAPVYPGRQLHCQFLLSFMLHAPPFEHGDEEHGFTRVSQYMPL
jgi:hypothetical protein